MRRKRRLAAVLSLAAAVALGVAGLAQAINGNSTVSFAITPSTGLGSTGKQVKINVHTHTNYTDGSTKATRARLFFDKNIVFSPTAVPKCDASTISGSINMSQAMAQCGTKLVGTGTAAANFVTPGDTHGCVLAFNALDANDTTGGNQPGILLFTRLNLGGPITCTNPSSNTQGNATIMLKAPLATNPASTTPGGSLPAAYYQGGKWLDFNNIPQAAQLADFNVTTGKGAPGTNLTGTKANYIKAKCTSRAGLGTPAKKWVMRTIFKYSAGSPLEQVVNSKKGPCT